MELNQPRSKREEREAELERCIRVCFEKAEARTVIKHWLSLASPMALGARPTGDEALFQLGAQAFVHDYIKRINAAVAAHKIDVPETLTDTQENE